MFSALKSLQQEATHFPTVQVLGKIFIGMLEETVG